MNLLISQGEAKQKQPGLFEPKASLQAAAERGLEISQIHAHAGSNTGDVCKKLQASVFFRMLAHHNAYRIDGVKQKGYGHNHA